MELSNEITESDSMMVANAVHKRATAKWNLLYFIRECQEQMESLIQVFHIYRKINKVANRLADWTHGHLTSVDFFREADLPNAVISSLFLVSSSNFVFLRYSFSLLGPQNF